jgi:uncharacterized protein (TIGR00255 family)
MIKSMTGFGRGRYEGNAFTCTVQVRSINHRFLDTHLKLPTEFAAIELRLKRLIQSRIRRGRLDLTFNVERDSTVEFTWNTGVLHAYLKAIEKLKQEFSLAGELDLVQLLRIPGILNLDGPALSSAAQASIEDGIASATEAALQELDRMRTEEGAVLREDVRRRLHVIEDEVALIRQRIQSALAAYQDRLKVRLSELLQGAPVDPNRLVQEAAFYVERSDITEEVTRLQSHAEQCEALLDGGDEAGKTLDFLLQEMNREANTILSKTTGLTGSGLEIANAAIVIKTEVEKMREQAQNVE